MSEPTLSGKCPDGHRCVLPVPCWARCSRLESAEIADELLEQAKQAVKPKTPGRPTGAGEQVRICKFEGCEKPVHTRKAVYCEEHGRKNRRRWVGTGFRKK